MDFSGGLIFCQRIPQDFSVSWFWASFSKSNSKEAQKFYHDSHIVLKICCEAIAGDSVVLSPLCWVSKQRQILLPFHKFNLIDFNTIAVKFWWCYQVLKL